MPDIVNTDNAARLEEIEDRLACVRRILRGTTYSPHYGDQRRAEIAALESEHAALKRPA